jgi:hypothetical protein
MAWYATDAIRVIKRPPPTPCMKSNVAVTTLPLFIDDRRWLGVPEDFFAACLLYTIPPSKLFVSLAE